MWKKLYNLLQRLHTVLKSEILFKAKSWLSFQLAASLKCKWKYIFSSFRKKGGRYIFFNKRRKFLNYKASPTGNAKRYEKENLPKQLLMRKIYIINLAKPEKSA